MLRILHLSHKESDKIRIMQCLYGIGFAKTIAPVDVGCFRKITPCTIIIRGMWQHIYPDHHQELIVAFMTVNNTRNYTNKFSSVLYHACYYNIDVID